MLQVLGHKYYLRQSADSGSITEPSQVAVDRTSPNGRVIGIDIIPALPPKGVSTVQGNFLSQAVQDEVKDLLKQSDMGRPQQLQAFNGGFGINDEITMDLEKFREQTYGTKATEAAISAHNETLYQTRHSQRTVKVKGSDRMVDVVLSDMSAPWDQTDGFWNRSLSNPYYRMMNTSGMTFRDHAGSMVRYISFTKFFLPLINRTCDRIFATQH